LAERQFLPDLGVGEALPLAQQDRLPLALGQPGERVPHTV
jgi:hypothetical protein